MTAKRLQAAVFCCHPGEASPPPAEEGFALLDDKPWLRGGALGEDSEARTNHQWGPWNGRPQ